MAIVQKNKAYKFPINPNEKQKELLAKIFGCTRLLPAERNYFLFLRTETYETDKIYLSYQDTTNGLTQLKKILDKSYIRNKLMNYQ